MGGCLGSANKSNVNRVWFLSGGVCARPETFIRTHACVLLFGRPSPTQEQLAPCTLPVYHCGVSKRSLVVDNLLFPSEASSLSEICLS